MKKINFIYLAAFVMLLTSCAVRKSSMDGSAALQGKQWQLVELRGDAVPAQVNGKMPYLKLDKENGRYSASGGCNGIGGEYTLQKKNGITFSRGMSTMMACEDMHVETGLRNLFDEADSYLVDGNTLTLSDSETGKVLAKFKGAIEE